MIKEICKNLDSAAKSVDSIDYTVVLRGDSTLRGHFPEARMTCLISISIFYSMILRLMFQLQNDMTVVHRNQMLSFQYWVKWMHG